MDMDMLNSMMCLAKERELIGNATELAEKCSNLLEKLSRYEVSTVLRKYGFTTKSNRKDGVSKYRYILSYEKLADIVERYASSHLK